MSGSEIGKEDQSPYEVSSKREILSYLKSIKNHNELVSITTSSSSDTLLTSILYISDDPDFVVILDGAKTQRENERFSSADEINFAASLDHIKIRFSVSAMRMCTYDEKPAFLIGCPEHFVRLQRREYYRITTPVTHPVLCHIPIVRADGKRETITLPILNISCGGVSLKDEFKQLIDSIGNIYENCILEINDQRITVDLEVRNSIEQNMINRPSRRKIGCAFVNIKNAALTTVQRYITKLECEQRSKIKDFE